MKKIMMLSLFSLAIVGSGCSSKSHPIDVSYVTAEEWGSEPASLEGREHVPTYVTIHHAGVPWAAGSDPVMKLKGLQSWGKAEKDWPDVPYHYLISPDGQIYEGRDTAYEPETNTSYDTNGHINVHLWGEFGSQRVTLEQLKSTVDITAKICQDLNISPDTIAGHLDRTDGTACPGADLYRYVSDGSITKWVKEELKGKVPDIQLKPELPDGPTEFVEM